MTHKALGNHYRKGITYKSILTVKGRGDSEVRFDRLNELKVGEDP